MNRRIKFFLLSLICVFMFSGCSYSSEFIEEEIYALDTLISFRIYSGSEEALSLAKEEVYRLEQLLSVTDDGSDISRINFGKGEWVKASEETYKLLEKAVNVSENTNGYFDVTVYPAVALWGFTGDEYRVPDKAELEDALEKIDYNNIDFDPYGCVVKVNNNATVDLGGIAKGYIADKAAQVLIENGVESALLNFGGNIRVIGSKPDSNMFNLGIKSPDGNGYFATVKAEDKTLSTAGGYERFFEEDGVVYHHILNPFTACPSDSGAVSSTVMGEDGAVCDALSTAVFVCGSENLAEIASKYPEYSFVLLTDECVYVSENLRNNFTLAEDYKSMTVKYI